MIEKRGRFGDADVDRFTAAGFSKDHVLEVIAIVAASTITNYTGSVTRTPLEAIFDAHAWTGCFRQQPAVASTSDHVAECSEARTNFF